MQAKFAPAPRGGGSAKAALAYVLHEELSAKVTHAQWNDSLHSGQREGVSALMQEARSRSDFGAGVIWSPTSGDGKRPSTIYARGVVSLQTAAAEMEGIARTQPRVKNPVVHIIVSLSESESKVTSDETLIRATERVLDSAGFADHQAIITTHRDTPNAHAHCIVGAVNPRTLRAWNQTQSHKRLHRALRESELHFDLDDEHGLYLVRDRGLLTERIEEAPLATRLAWKREEQAQRLEDMAQSFISESDGLENGPDRRDRVVHAIHDYFENCDERDENPLRADLHAIAARLAMTIEPGLYRDTLGLRLMERLENAQPSTGRVDNFGEADRRFARWQPTDTLFEVKHEWLGSHDLLRDLGNVETAEKEVRATITRDPGRISRDLIAGGQATFTPEDFDRWTSERTTVDWELLSNYAQAKDRTIEILSPDTEFPLMTTAAQRTLEKDVYERAMRLAKMPDPLFDEAALKQAIGETEEVLGFKFSLGQLRAFDMTRYRFSVLQGEAGSGKSAMMAVLRRYSELTNRSIGGLATSQLAAENLGKRSGIRSVNTARARALEAARGLEMIPQDSLSIVDESSMVSFKSIDAALKRIESQGANGMCILDRAQLENIEAGNPGEVLTLVGKETGQFAEVTRVFRQQGDEVAWMRKALPAAGKAIRDNKPEVFRRYLEMFIERGHFSFHDDRRSEVAAKAKDIVDAAKRGERVLSTGFSRQDNLYVNRRIREELGLAGTGKNFRVRRGVREFAPGDKIIFEKNDERWLKVLNGTLGVVQSVNVNALSVQLDDGRTIEVEPKRYPFLDYSWSLTVHKSQGQSAHVAVPTLGKLDNARSAHVALSRAEQGLRVHTRMSKEELLNHLTSDASMRPKEDALLFESLVRKTGGAGSSWANAVREAMAKDDHPRRQEHRREMTARNAARGRALDEALRLFAVERGRATTEKARRALDARERRELDAIYKEHRLDSFVSWAARNRRHIEDDVQPRQSARPRRSRRVSI